MDMLSLLGLRARTVDPRLALKGREEEVLLPQEHAVLGTPLSPPWPAGMEVLTLGGGCFWGFEKMFWEVPGVYVTRVGYAGGQTRNPTYEEVCSGRTNHAEVVQVVFDPQRVSRREILKRFWEGHDPTQGMRQGNDVGTQYRSAVYWSNSLQLLDIETSKKAYQEALTEAGFGEVTTEVAKLASFYPAEEYHQQYLFKVPNGYCPVHSTGVSCPVGLGVAR